MLPEDSMRTKYTGIVTYKSVHNAIVSQVDERKVLGYKGKERNLKHKEILLTHWCTFVYR